VANEKGWRESRASESGETKVFILVSLPSSLSLHLLAPPPLTLTAMAQQEKGTFAVKVRASRE